MDPIYKPRYEIEFLPGDWAIGAAQLQRYANGELVATEHDHLCAIVVLAAQTEFLVALQSAHLAGNAPQDSTSEQWVWDSLCSGQRCVFGAQQDEADRVGFGDLYRSTQQVARDLYNGSQAVGGPVAHIPTLPPGGVEDFAGLGALPAVAIYAIALTGAFAMGAFAWWGTDKNEKQAKVDMHAAELATQLAQYQAWLDDNFRRGGPAPEAPPLFQAVSAQASQSGWVALAAGVLLGGVAVVGVQRGATATRARSVTRRQNPRRPARRLAPPARARRTTRKRPAAKKTARKRNPKTPAARSQDLFDKATRADRAAERAWYRIEQGSYRGAYSDAYKKAAALDKKAKALWAKFDDALMDTGPATAKKRNPKKAPRRKTTRKRNAKKTSRKKATRKRLKVTAKKKAPARKRNAKKIPAKGTTERSRFLRSQMAKGRSRKQAEAAWKGKARLQKINKAKKRPKARRRRRAA